MRTHSTQRLIPVVLLVLMLLTALAAPAVAQEGAPSVPLAAAPSSHAIGAPCTPLSEDEQATFDKLAKMKEAGQLDNANYDLFLKLSERANCAAQPAAPDAINAVSSGYTFAQSTGSYTAITGGTQHGTGGIDDNLYSNIGIGFTFKYDSTDYTTVAICANGYVVMGLTSGTSCNPVYAPISDSTYNNVIAALARDLQGNTSGGELRSQLQGTSPNHTFTVQWTSFRKYNDSNDNFNFQIKLYETTNVVEVKYGAFTVNTTSSTVQVGLKGASTSDYNNRTSTSSWSASTAGTSNSATMTLSNSVKPDSGQTYTWTPAPPSCATIGAPTNGATGISINPSLSWTAGTGSAPTSYDVYFGTAANPPYVTNVAASPYSPGTLSYSATYYWKIIPRNAAGSATGCSVWSFTTMADPTVSVFPYSQTFDGTVTGWTYEDTNNDGNVWALYSGTSFSRYSSGVGLAVRYNANAAMNDWLFPPPLQLTGGITYGVRFFYRAYSTSFPEKMEVKWGSTASSAGMTSGQIFNDATINFITMKEAIATFTPASSGIYYVGFHGYSAADEYYLILDDITIYNTADSTWLWQGGTSSDWGTNANWEGGIVPGSLDTVQIPVVADSPQANTPLVGQYTETSYGPVTNLTVNSGATLELASTNSLAVGSTVTNNGTLKQTKTVAASGTTSFLNIPTAKYYGVDITAGATALGSTVVSISGNQVCPQANGYPVKRCFVVNPTTTANSNVTFYYTYGEMQGQTATSLKAWKYSGSAWSQAGTSTTASTCTTNQLNCSVAVTGVSAYAPPTGQPDSAPEASTGPFALKVSSPQAITLADFSAAQTGDAVLLTWETNSELENRGFNLYRGTSPTEPDRQLNELLIPSQAPGSPGGYIYTWEDRADLVSGTTYYYWVEDVDMNNVATRHGPVSVDYSAPTAVHLLDSGVVTTLPLALPLMGAGLLALAGLAARRRRR